MGRQETGRGDDERKRKGKTRENEKGREEKKKIGAIEEESRKRTG